MLRAKSRCDRHARQLRLERLEVRRVLAGVIVTSPTDVVDWDQIGGIQQLVSNPGADNKISLREAIIAANQTFDGATDTITFSTNPADGLDGGTIFLSLALGELTITDSVTIDASMLEDGLTIVASANSRIFNVTGNGSSQVEINGLTLTGGNASGSGGAIASVGAHLAVKNSIVSGNTALLGNGGGLYVRDGNLLVEGSTISNGSRWFGVISTLAA